MKRQLLFAWYQTPRGELLRQVEAEFIRRSIMVGCKQCVLQIGGLGWENEFIDCSLYENFMILDAHNLGWADAVKIQAKSCNLPLQSESVDLILLPHLLEFDPYRFQTMREIERVLKPEGHLIIINFSPWSFWVRYQYLKKKKWADSWHGHFISKQRVLDWLKLLNFETRSAASFSIEHSPSDHHGHFKAGYFSFFTAAYAIRAIKRRYTLIPLAPATVKRPRLAVLNSLESSQRLSKDD
ncbi:MAG: methyltransferase type 11 [Gammaproteobacteria bacterium HGW-Gammaproteobacteria-3]|nr:MAG: methyltransferase type 11 [Gammaproteobacteria bacterium HGW-Gammaproteobacteria-3]